jgi:hypothetical protein
MLRAKNPTPIASRITSSMGASQHRKRKDSERAQKIDLGA